MKDDIIRHEILLNDAEEEFERIRQGLLISIPELLIELKVSIEKEKRNIRRAEIVICVLMPLLGILLMIMVLIA